MSKKIELTQGKYALVDDDDHQFINQFKWFAEKRDRRWYARTNMRDINGKVSKIYMHKLINNTPEGVDTDHRDGDGLNNQRCNLRNATRSQNFMNKSKGITNKSGFKGVSWHAQSSKWRAQIVTNKKYKHLGIFTNLEDAANAYIQAAKQKHGIFYREQ